MQMQLGAIEERRMLLSQDYESVNQQLAEERKRNITWQSMAMDSQKRLTSEIHAAETERSQFIDLQFRVSTASFPRLTFCDGLVLQKYRWTSMFRSGQERTTYQTYNLLRCMHTSI